MKIDHDELLSLDGPYSHAEIRVENLRVYLSDKVNKTDMNDLTERGNA